MNKKSIVLPICIATCCLMAANVVADESLVRMLSDAIEALDRPGKYRWTTTTDSPGETRFRPGPTAGFTERGGLTHVTMSFGSRSTHVVIDGNKAAVTNRDGDWETVSLSDQGYRSEGFAASLARNVQTPAAEAREIVPSLTDLREEGDVLVGTLQVETAKLRLVSPRGGTESVRDAKGSVRFWINDGQLAKYEVQVEGRIRDDDEDRDTWRHTAVEIADVGTAMLELPHGATEALSRPLTSSQPRMSDKEAAELLKIRGKRNVEVHDPSSIVKCGDEYWLFSTGTGVSSWRSKDLHSWQGGPRVFPEIPPWVTEVVPEQRGHFWAPDVIRHQDRFLLYYSVSSFGKNTSAIALASTPTLDPDDPAYQWTDHGILIQSQSGDDFNAIDPAVIRTESGELWMSFGSFWSGLKLLELDPHSGKRIADGGPLHSIASSREIEAPYIYQRDGWFFLFVNWGECCRGVDSTYNIRVGRSRNITGPYLDKEDNDLAKGGGTLLLDSQGPFIGPGHASIFHEGDRYWLSCHFYDGTERGRSMLAIQELTWAEDGCPVVAEIVAIVRDTRSGSRGPAE